MGVGRTVAGVAVLFALASGDGQAQPGPGSSVLTDLTPAQPAALAASRQALFERMMADPANLDIAFEYAALSAQAGDLEGAIATLERMLIFAPGLPRLQLELGVLYFRLGAYDTARAYFESAVAGPDVPEEVQVRVASYLAAITARSSLNDYGGAILAGVRYQSNANAAPDSRTVTLNGIDFLLDEASTGEPDVNAFVAGNFYYSRDLASQGDRIQANLLTYGALYANRSELNTGLAEVTIGPSFNMERFGIEGATFDLYGIAGGVYLEHDPYLLSAGVGAAFNKWMGPSTLFSLRSEYRYESFQDSIDRPTSSLRTGDRIRASAALRHQVTPRFAIFSILQGERRNASEDYLSLWDLGTSVGGSWAFAPPIETLVLPWSFALTFGYQHREYDEPDLLFSSEPERDDEAFVLGTLAMPIDDGWSLQAQGGYRVLASNYDMRDFDNVSASLAVLKEF